MFRTRILGLFRLFRFELPFTAGVCVILGELLALGKLPTTTEIVQGYKPTHLNHVPYRMKISG